MNRLNEKCSVIILCKITGIWVTLTKQNRRHISTQNVGFFSKRKNDKNKYSAILSYVGSLTETLCVQFPSGPAKPLLPDLPILELRPKLPFEIDHIFPGHGFRWRDATPCLTVFFPFHRRVNEIEHLVVFDQSILQSLQIHMIRRYHYYGIIWVRY